MQFLGELVWNVMLNELPQCDEVQGRVDLGLGKEGAEGRATQDGGNRPLTMEELRVELARRETLLQAPPPNAGPSTHQRPPHR